jgi:aminoglycoside phosphotransferase (APT) family kinase protein
MQIPAELRRPPPRPARDWVERTVGPGARVVRVRRLRNAWAAAMHAVDVDDEGGARHSLVLRRWARTDLPPDVGVVANERAALIVAAGAAVPTPDFVAADASGREAGAPALLMSRLAGRDALAPRDRDQWLAGLARALHAIHDTAVPEGVLAYFRPWNLDTVTAPPRWTSVPDVWAHAIEIANQPAPAHTRVLVHRDYHPGNVLWRDHKVSGVVDWTHACRGPAAADVAHCRVNLAILFDGDTADDFARRYGELDDQPWHDIVDVVGLGNDTPPDAWRWNDAGRADITTTTVVQALDAFLARAVARLG